MPLKLDVLGQQIEQMTEAAVAEDRNGALERAHQLMASVDPADLRARSDEHTVLGRVPCRILEAEMKSGSMG